MQPNQQAGNQFLCYWFITSADKTSFQCQNINGLPITHNSWFVVAQTLATARLFAFRAERLALGESSFGWNAKLQGDARNLAEALHVMQTTQPAKFADLVKLTREVFPDIADISVRPKVGTPNMQEIILWNEEAARRRADLAFTLAESGTGIGQVELVVDVYRRLSTHNSLMPRIYGFLFDRERLSETEQADLARLAGGLVHFLPYRMYENYLLVPDAIAAKINSFSTMVGSPITGTDVANWINTNGAAPDLVRSPGTGSAVFTDGWHRDVHGARLLGKAFAHFTNNVEPYDKVRHGLDLTNFILMHVPNHFGDLTNLIENVLNVAP